MSSGHDLRHRHAFTLVELVLAMAIGAILLLAMGSALMSTTSAADAGSDSNNSALKAATAATALAADLSVATSIPTVTARDLMLQVPDRNNDGSPERIEYTWSGVANAPLYRSYNGGAPAMFIPCVRSISLTTAARPPAQPITSAETTLMACDTTTAGVPKTLAIAKNTSGGFYVRPTLPSDCQSWAITKIALSLAQSGAATETLRIAVCTADASLKPTTTELAAVTIAESALPSSASWTTFAIGPVTGLSPSQGVCIVVSTPATSSTAASMDYYQKSGGVLYNTHLMWTAGGNWIAPADDYDARFILTGTYTTLVEP